MRSAMATASSTVSAASPAETGMPKDAKNCLPWYSKRSTGAPGWGRRSGGGGFPLVKGRRQPLGDGDHGGPRREDLGNALVLEHDDVGLRHDPAAEDHHVVEPAGGELLLDAREQRHVGAGEDRQPDGVGVLLQRG